MLSWQPDRRQPGATRAEYRDASLHAESDGFRVELGSLSIDGDAQNLDQAQCFAEVAADALIALDSRLTDADKARLGKGARAPARPMRLCRCVLDDVAWPAASINFPGPHHEAGCHRFRSNEKRLGVTLTADRDCEVCRGRGMRRELDGLVEDWKLCRCVRSGVA